MSRRADDPTEQLLDVLVYAPLGLLLEARDLLPKLADKGRQRMGGQVTVARMVGELAVRQGQRRAEKILERLRQQNSGAGAGAGAGAASARPAGSGGQPTNGHQASSASVTDIRPTPPPEPGPAAAPTSGSLAIPGYDTLSASQVVPRLEGLSVGELEAVAAYEQATRGRKTVLNRIEQLRGRA